MRPFSLSAARQVKMLDICGIDFKLLTVYGNHESIACPPKKLLLCALKKTGIIQSALNKYLSLVSELRWDRILENSYCVVQSVALLWHLALFMFITWASGYGLLYPWVKNFTVWSSPYSDFCKDIHDGTYVSLHI